MLILTTKNIMYNVFLNNNDPTLHGNNFARSIDEQLANIRQLEQQLSQYKQSQPSNATPIWDEIDNIVSGLTDSEKELLANDEEFNESNNAVLAVLQREYLRIMRPIVEASSDGKEALQSHLATVKRLAKKAKEQTAEELKEFREYKLKKQRK